VQVSENELAALPPWISTWTSVQYLDAANNRLGSDPRSLSEGLGSLQSLTEVSLRRNFLTCGQFFPLVVYDTIMTVTI
jgi:Leucine-rich repeat (LRR) protein